jgi:hypothetical protein
MGMKSILKTLFSILDGIGQATHAAQLARGGKYKEAQALYRN